MLMLKVTGTGSAGNNMALCKDDKIILLDLGMKKSDVMKTIDYRISDVEGAVITHEHT